MRKKEINQHQKKIFSMEEKRNYCMEWKKSEMNQTDFCKVGGISRSSLYKWIKEFKEEVEDFCFAPLILSTTTPINEVDMIQLKISLPNKRQLKLTMPKHCLASFIKDIGYEITVIR